MDQRNLLTLPLSEVQRIYDLERYASYREVANLLARPMSASALADKVLVNFAANQLVPTLQTIGRGMRKRMPVNVYFVDAAWAPRSAEQQQESTRSSLLVVMQKILADCIADRNPDLRDIYQALLGFASHTMVWTQQLPEDSRTTIGDVVLGWLVNDVERL